MTTRYWLLLVGILCFTCVDASSGHSKNNTEINLVKLHWEHLHIYITITVFVLAMIIVKMVYEYLECFSSVIPESCMLIIIGIIFGAILKYGVHYIHSIDGDVWRLGPDLFLLILLPPIVLEAAHGLSQRAFADVFGPVILMSVAGTFVTFSIIGLSLYGLNIGGAMGANAPNMTISHSLLFGSLIVAVDPVAVLAIFEEIGVDKTLYFLVFGESLFNDAVTIVLYNMMSAFVNITTVTTRDVIFGILSFFTISIGGTIIGVIFGVLSCLIMRCSIHSRLIQPLIIFTMAYASYLAGDVVGWSGIISMIFCGIIQSSYAFHNMSEKSVIVTKKTLKIMAKLCESIIFLYLGIEVTRGDLKWSTGFVLWSLLLCLITRFMVTFLLALLLNKTGGIFKRISFTEQFVIGYGGLRGAVAFSLASTVNKAVFVGTTLEKEHFVTATLFIVLFTIFPMGITMKPLVKLLKIHLEENKGLSVIDEISENTIDHLKAGVEAITGFGGRNVFREWTDNFETKYIKRFLQNNPESRNQHIVDVYEKVSLALHYATIDHNHSCAKYLDKLCTPLKDRFLHEHPSFALQDEAACHSEDCHRKGRRRSLYHSFSTLVSLLHLDHHSDHDRTRKSSFAVAGKMTVNPEVQPGDYAGLVKQSLVRQNAIRRNRTSEVEEYTNRMRNALLRDLRRNHLLSTLFGGRHVHRGMREEIHQNMSLSGSESVDGLALRMRNAMEQDMPCPHRTHCENINATDTPRNSHVVKIRFELGDGCADCEDEAEDCVDRM